LYSVQADVPISIATSGGEIDQAVHHPERREQYLSAH